MTGHGHIATKRVWERKRPLFVTFIKILFILSKSTTNFNLTRFHLANLSSYYSSSCFCIRLWQHFLSYRFVFNNFLIIHIKRNHRNNLQNRFIDPNKSPSFSNESKWKIARYFFFFSCYFSGKIIYISREIHHL